jgi:DNA transposition AAA+ family ATPase
MSAQNLNTLDGQVIARISQFLKSTNISQKRLAREIGSDPGNFSAYLAGTKGLAVTKMAKLLGILGMNQTQLVARFNPAVTSIVAHYQSFDGKMKTG